MANLREIKGKMRSVWNLKKITRALEVVSTVKLQKLKDQADALKWYLSDLMMIVSTVWQTHSIFWEKKIWWEKKLVLVITSERWLCGGLNSKLLRKIHKETKGENTDYFVVWKKWLEFLKRVWSTIVWSLQIWDNFVEKDLLPLFTFFDKSLWSGEYSEVNLYFNYFKNSIFQIPTSVELYPFSKESLDTFLWEIQVEVTSPELENKDLMIEPNLPDYLVEIRRQIRNYIISSAIVQNKTWEHAARMIAMKSAKDNATDMWKSLKRTFNKARQWAITQEISEIVSAKIAIEG